MRKLFLILFSVAAFPKPNAVITRTHPIIIGARAQEPTAKTKELDRFITALERIQAGYVDRLDRSGLIDAANKGMVGVFDSQLFRDMQVTHAFGPAGSVSKPY